MARRRYSALPTIAELTKVSGIVLLSILPAAPATAAAYGKTVIVGELEDGPFNQVVDMIKSSDQAAVFGGFGFTLDGTKYQYPCALQSGGNEYWNGNAWVQTQGLTFGSLAFVRVDTSVGSVILAPLAFAQGSIKAPFALDNAVTTIFSVDGGANTTVTWAAAAAVKTGTGGTFSGVTGGETIQIAYDGGSYTTVTLQPGDITAAAIVSRINEAFGFTFASVSSSNLRFTSPTKGTGSQVKIAGSSFTDTLGLTTSGATSTTNGTGDAANIALTTQAEFKAKLEAASGSIRVTTSANGYPRIVSKTAVTGTIQVKTHTASDGFAVQSAAVTGALPANLTIPAGTRCSDGGAAGTILVTMQSTDVLKGSVAAVSIKVRPAVDDGTYAGAAGGAIDTITDQPGDLEWHVSNSGALSAALTATQLDSLYIDAIAATKGPGDGKRRKISVIVSARQSDSIRAEIVNNAITTSAVGHYRRQAVITPRLGSTEAQILASAAPGVGAYRSENCAFAAGGIKVRMQAMIDAGYASSEGWILRHPDVFLASRLSSLPPGYNPGQLPEEERLRWTKTFVVGIEDVAATWDIDSWAAFKATGVCAVVYDEDLGLTFEQGITTVDPEQEAGRVDIGRAVLEGHLGDTFANFSSKDAKRQGSQRRIDATVIAIEGFLDSMKAPQGDVIETYTFAPIDSGIAKVRWYNLEVKKVQSDDVIVLGLGVSDTAIQVRTGG